MNNKELKRMSRTELLELLIEQMEENEKLRAELESKTRLLNERQITLQKAGSIAKAALELNKIFEAADAAAKQYVESVYRLADEKIHLLEEKHQEDTSHEAQTKKNS